MIRAIDRFVPAGGVDPVRAIVPAEKTAGAEKVHIWLDLGGVIIGAPGSGGVVYRGDNPLGFMPGALEYLQSLMQAGYTIGAITNIPESFGRPGDRASKVQALKDYVARNWKDPTRPFDWSIFDHILVPTWDRERKPAPKLFREARLISEAAGQIGFYQGETCSEIVASHANGIPAFHVKYADGNRPIFLPAEKIPAFVEDPVPPTCTPAR